MTTGLSKRNLGFPPSSAAAHVAGPDAAREGMLIGMRAAIEPQNVLEEVLLEEIVDLTNEIAVYRNVKSRYLKMTQYKGIKLALTPAVGPLRANDLAKNAAIAALNKDTHQPDEIDYPGLTPKT